jgi:hypothetical protein
MAIIDVYVGVTAQPIRVKCRTKDKRDIVCRAARKLARNLGGSSATPTLKRKPILKDSPVNTLRLSKAVVDDMVLVAEKADGTRRVLLPDELPVELLLNSNGDVRRLLLLTPAMMASGVSIANASPIGAVNTNEGSDEEDTSASNASVPVATGAAAPVDAESKV